MQVVSFQVPRLYEDIPIQIGSTAENPVPVKFLVPFSEDVINSFQYGRYAYETLAQFWGIDNNAPLPPTLNYTGRFSSYLNPVILSDLHAELTPVYGYPGWLNVTVRDFLVYDAKKTNSDFLQTSTPLLDDLKKKLSEFNDYIKKGIIAEKIVIDFQTPNFDEVSKKSSLKYIEQETGYKREKQYVLNQHVSTSQKLNLIEIPINKEISYKSFLEFNFAGDKSIYFTYVDLSKAYTFIGAALSSNTGAVNHRIPPFSPLTYPPDTCSITLHYKAKEVKVFFPKKPKIKPKPTPILDPEPEPIAVPVPTEHTQEHEPFRWLWAVLLFVIVLIVLQKTSE